MIISSTVPVHVPVKLNALSQVDTGIVYSVFFKEKHILANVKEK